MLVVASPILDWATKHGGKVATGVEIRSDAHGGSGLFATADLPATTELVYLPAKLQLGVPQLASSSSCTGLQEMARKLPWRDLLESDLTHLPCAMALCAEKAKGERSDWATYIRELPLASSAMAPSQDRSGGWGHDAYDMRFDTPPGLASSAPLTAMKVRRARRAIRSVWAELAPKSLPLHELCWASACVTSRSFVRPEKRVRGSVSPEAAERIGVVTAVDCSRLLPLIDNCNHAPPPAANAVVGHVGHSHDAHDPDPLSYDPLATSLIATRPIARGEEILIDYGAGDALSSERLLLDYGAHTGARTLE